MRHFFFVLYFVIAAKGERAVVSRKRRCAVPASREAEVDEGCVDRAGGQRGVSAWETRRHAAGTPSVCGGRGGGDGCVRDAGSNRENIGGPYFCLSVCFFLVCVFCLFVFYFFCLCLFFFLYNEDVEKGKL